jgi:uncharacterized SAM-binding protein YcdF (DUF218 family)
MPPRSKTYDYYIIFGATVREDGRPSGTLARRIQGALEAAASNPRSRFMPTGGQGASGHVEAEVVRRLLRDAGVPLGHIVVEPRARDTLQSIRLCDTLLRTAGDVDRVIPCTSRYHVPRCALLLRLLGWRVRLTPMPSDLGHLPLWKLATFYLKELIALPYDIILLLCDRRHIA